MSTFLHVKQGDVIARSFGVGDPMKLRVTRIDDKLIHCGDWTFDRVSGAEVDDDLGWGPKYGRTGSQIIGVETPV